MKTFFQDNNGDELILLFDGWGMDERPYKPLKSSRDVLFISNYCDLDLSFDFDFNKYKKVILISFSAGVFMAAFLKDMLPKIDIKIAINGTLWLQNETLGIPKDIFSQMENITLENALDFRKKLVDTQEHLRIFNKTQPLRDLKSSQDELRALKKYHTTSINNFEYDKIIIGKNDEIIPCKNQLKAWDGHKNTRIIDGGHFLVYSFNSFDEIVSL